MTQPGVPGGRPLDRAIEVIGLNHYLETWRAHHPSLELELLD